MLDALRDGDPVPAATDAGLDRLAALADEFRASGPRVSLTIDPAALRLSDPALDQAAYRIVQEALTNVVRHAGPVRVNVVARVAAIVSSSRSSMDRAGAQPARSRRPQPGHRRDARAGRTVRRDPRHGPDGGRRLRGAGDPADDSPRRGRRSPGRLSMSGDGDRPFPAGPARPDPPIRVVLADDQAMVRSGLAAHPRRRARHRGRRRGWRRRGRSSRWFAGVTRTSS